MARALPRLVRSAPGDETAKVRAAGREDVRVAGLIAVDGLMAKADPDDGALAGRELLRCGARADSIGDEAPGNAPVFRGE